MGEPDEILSVRDLSIGFGERTVIDSVSFAVRRGEIFVIMGPSGCGKTTLLKAITGLIPKSGGEVAFHGRPLETPDDFADFRRRLGMVFQQGALLNSVSLEDNVALPLREHERLPEWMVRNVVRMKLAQVGLLSARRRMPMELSGGMRKRAGIARAIALEPELLFFDEPSGGLDPVTADGIDNLVLALREHLGVTVIAVSHELASIFKIADRVMMLAEGRIAAVGSRREMQAIEDPLVADFIGRRARSEGGAADRFLDATSEGRTTGGAE